MWGSVLSLFCYALLCVLSIFAIIVKRKREIACCFVFIFLRKSYYCKSYVAHPDGTVGLSTVYDCGISCSYSLIF